MKVIKSLVLFMGALIVLGVGFLAYGLMTKSGKVVETPPIPAPASVTGNSPLGLLDVNLNQPVGSRIVSTSSGGGQLYMTVEGGGTGPRVLIVDLASGRLIGTVRLGGGP
ncbi:MAG: hypothetical protein A2516_07740 [Alphaproteobacteria bacterium RIFOXYD12_FULL_60_8]|nr:MAG: hypothetical protein A2516_07740 [Alphaproteobacteria bacterium RIFOXYD12_FULL_60_8]